MAGTSVEHVANIKSQFVALRVVLVFKTLMTFKYFANSFSFKFYVAINSRNSLSSTVTLPLLFSGFCSMKFLSSWYIVLSCNDTLLHNSVGIATCIYAHNSYMSSYKDALLYIHVYTSSWCMYICSNPFPHTPTYIAIY